MSKSLKDYYMQRDVRHEMIKKCECKHEGQDELHGNGNRVWNAIGKDWCCSVCKKITVGKESK